jgi:hypothetical protein
MNRNKAVKITTLGFNPWAKPREILEQIARQHGGYCRMVEPDS